MIFQSPGDVFLSVAGFPIYYYGVIMAFACFTGIFVAYKIIKREEILDFAVYLLIFGFLGARLYYCLVNLDFYISNPTEIFNFRAGGLSIHGGILSGIVTLIILAKKYKLQKLKTLDGFGCGLALAQSIGRWGNFFNSEAFGTPTDLPWKLYIPQSHRPEQYAGYEYFHPTFLYESILDFFVFLILLFIVKKYGEKFQGVTLFAYLILYGTVRLLVESLRTDSVLNPGGIPIAIIISTILLVTGLIGCVYIIKKNCIKI